MALVKLYIRGLQCQHVQIKCQNVQIQVLWKRMSMALVTLCDRGLGGLMDWDSSHTRTQTDKPHSFLLSFGRYFSLNILLGTTTLYWRHRHSTIQVLRMWICHVYFKMKRSMDWNALHLTRQAVLLPLTIIFRGWKVQEDSVDFFRCAIVPKFLVRKV